MNSTRVRAVLLSVAIATSLLPPAYAASSKFEEIQAKKKAQRDAAAKQAVMTQAEVDRLIRVAPLVREKLKDSGIADLNAEQKKQMSLATLSGRPTTQMAEFIDGTSALLALDRLTKREGYRDFKHYAGHQDIAFGVLSAQQWILMARDIGVSDEDKGERILNLWMYIHDDTKPAADREKLSSQLDDMLPRFSTNRGNAEIVFRNLDSLKPILLGE